MVFKKLNGHIPIWLQRILTIIVLAFCSWLVLQIDNLRNTMPEQYVLASTYERDLHQHHEKLNMIIVNQNKNIEIVRNNLNDLRKEVINNLRAIEKLFSSP